MPDPEVVATPLVAGDPPAVAAQPEIQPAEQEVVDLTSLGFNTKIPKAVMEKIAAYDPETLAYLEKLDLKDRKAYDTSFENWNKGQAKKMTDYDVKEKALSAKEKEVEKLVKQHNQKLSELDKVFGDKLWENELPDESKQFISELKQAVDAGELTQERYDKLTKPLIDTAKNAILARKDSEDNQVKSVLSEINKMAGKVAPKYGFTNEIVSHFIKGLCAEMEISPDKARELFESEIDRVINLHLVRSPKTETISPDTKTPPAIPVKIDSPQTGPTREDKAQFMGGIFRSKKTG
jgi:hypothetical protein